MKRVFFLALFTSELLRQEQAKLNEARKISVVNVNPTNIRPHSDTPEIRKYKKRFNSEILCAALWGKSPFVLGKSTCLLHFPFWNVYPNALLNFMQVAFYI